MLVDFAVNTRTLLFGSMVTLRGSVDVTASSFKTSSSRLPGGDSMKAVKLNPESRTWSEAAKSVVTFKSSVLPESS